MVDHINKVSILQIPHYLINSLQRRKILCTQQPATHNKRQPKFLRSTNGV